jgi:dTDP-glucose 4,6-dehydratase
VSEPFDVPGPVDLGTKPCQSGQSSRLSAPGRFATLRVGSFGTHHTLDLARTKGAAYLLTSTSEGLW